MSKAQTFYDTVNQIASEGIHRGILQLFTKDLSLEGNTMLLGEKPTVNFGSCSYLGLEFDERLKRGAIQAIEEYGTQFSAARIYVSSKHYEELESLTDEIFGAHTLVAPTTTLAHLAVIPVIINDDDAIILDHQAHNSMQNMVNQVKPRGVHVEMIRHNNMEMLESRVKALRQKHRRIWYFADGIYSMYGDATPVDDVYALMEKYPELHYYVDDAHGMSCYGKHGSGYVLSKKPLHEKMIMATSLNKAFASGGSALLFPNKELATKVRNTGAPFLSSGPMQPASLGAAIASAKIHLSDEIYSLQEDLQENIKYTNLMLRKYGMPNVAENNSPVCFVGVSLPAVGFNMIQRLLKEGFYTNLGVFPTVPMKNTGIRFTITRLHTFEQIDNMIGAMAHHFPLALAEEGFNMEKLYKAFKMTPPEEQKIDEKLSVLINQSKFKMEHCSTILDVNKEEWDALLGDRGTFNWEGMNLLENSFKNIVGSREMEVGREKENSKLQTVSELPEDNWEFDYVTVRDLTGKPILTTFLTTSVSKDDIFSAAEISAQVEEKRKTDKYYLCSKTLMCGSLLTEGNHLYIDRESPYWKDALKLLFEKISELQEKYKATVLNLRDFDSNDAEMDSFFAENGFFKMAMPENNIVEDLNWENAENFISDFSKRNRKSIRQEVFKHENKFIIETISEAKTEEIEYFYELYLNVKGNNLGLNTFTLPYKVFENMAKDKNWEMVVLKLKSEFDYTLEQKPVAVVFCFKGKENYNPIIIGLDYTCPREHNAYRQSIYQVILRAKQLGMKKVRLGFSATVEKRKFGAKVSTPCAYLQLKDNYNMEALGTMSAMRKMK